MKSNYLVEDLCGLPGMTKTPKGIYDRIKAGTLKATPRKNADGSYSKFMVIARASLPPETQLHLQKLHLADSLPAGLPAAPVPAVVDAAQLPALTELTSHQIAVMDARVFFMRLIENRPATYSIKKAQAEICAQVAAGDQTYAAMATAANDRQGKARTLHPRTLMRWWSERWLPSGKKPAALAPNDSDSRRVNREAVLVSWVRDYRPGSLLAPPPEVPAWLPHLLDEYRRPSAPALADSVRKVMLPVDMPRPSYEQAHRLLEKIPAIYREKGRKTGAEYRALLPFSRRDWSQEEPFACGQIDGHSLKAYVAHPTTGAHFHPEICGIICMRTKYLAGWSAGVAESWRTVSDTFRHACTAYDGKFGGVFSRIEADRGAGNMAIKNSDKLIGIFARGGCTLVIPEKGGNPQGHGGVERGNQSIWIRAAKSLITYTGKDMDRVTRKKVNTRLEQDLNKAKKAGGLGAIPAGKTSDLLMSWREFLTWLEEKAWEYNHTEHSALPMITDQSGRRRHMTPAEAVQDYIARGWEPVRHNEEFLAHLFMPHERIKKIDRGEFTLHGNRYFSWDLNRYHGQPMIAAYDIHDAHTVWVLTPDQRLVCQAIWNGNRVAGRAESVREQEDRHREEGRAKLKETQLALIRAETPELTIELTPENRTQAEARFMELETPVTPAKVITLRRPDGTPPIFGTDLEKYQWLTANQAQQTTDDAGWLDWYINTTEFRLMFGDDDAAFL